MERILIKEILQSNRAISSLDGDKVNQILVDRISNENQVILDFSEITLTITAFLNSAIGKLYSQFSQEQIRLFLTIENLNNEDLELLKLVIEKAKVRFGVN